MGPHGLQPGTTLSRWRSCAGPEGRTSLAQGPGDPGQRGRTNGCGRSPEPASPQRGGECPWQTGRTRAALEQVAHLDVLLHLHRLEPREQHGRRQFGR